jgi:hypothetical protein
VSATYSIDTSALMAWWMRRYPPEIFPAIREAMEKLIADGKLLANEYVLTELGGKDDPLFDWAKRQSGLFVKTDAAVQQKAQYLIRTYPLLIDTESPRPMQADPFIVALAQVKGLTVVTEETFAHTKLTGKRRKRTYIPDVCANENIPCLSFLEMMRAEKWCF